MVRSVGRAVNSEAGEIGGEDPGDSGEESHRCHGDALEDPHECGGRVRCLAGLPTTAWLRASARRSKRLWRRGR